jgi:Protein of unknown function (DUF3014)
MNRDDRLFATIGGTIVTAAATVFLVFAGGITGPVEDRPIIRVAPMPLVQTAGEPSDIVPASYVEPVSMTGDDFVRRLASGISAHPEWVSWLVTDGLVERFVASVEAVADGYSPSGELGFVATEHPFLVREDEGRLVIAAGTYRRYNLAVEVLGSVDAEAAVAILRELEPAIEEARQDVAWHRGSFEDRLRQAIDHLLAVEVPTGVIEVERRTRTYTFADDDFERMSDAQRHLLRMGRRNALAVQAKLRNIRSVFGWPASEPPEAVQQAVDESKDAEALEPVVIAEAFVERTDSEVSEEAVFSPRVEPVMTVVDMPVWGPSPPLMIAFEPSPAPAE